MCGFLMLLPEFFVSLLLLLAVALVFILTLSITHAGYLHLVSACFKCFFFLLQQFRAGANGFSSVMQ